MLDTSRVDSNYDRLTALAATLFGTPISLVTLIDSDRQWFKSAVGLGVPQTHRNLAFCSYAVLEDSEDVLVVSNATEDPRFRDNRLVTGPPFIKFYAGAVLVVDGYRLGTLCIIDTKPRQDFLEKERETLFELAKLVSNAICWDRMKFMGNQRKAQVALSLTHNINTLSTALHLQIENLLAGHKRLTDSSDAIFECLSNMNSMCSDIMTKIVGMLALGKALPSLTASFVDVCEESAYGPKCHLFAVLQGFTNLVSLMFPGLCCDLCIDIFKGSMQECFVDVFVMISFAALNSMLSHGSQIESIGIHFGEAGWSTELNTATDKMQSTGNVRVGDVIFTVWYRSTESRLVVDEGLVSTLDIISGTQCCRSSENGTFEYQLRIPCRVSEKDATSTDQKGLDERSRPIRVLVVDDDVTFSTQLCQYLERQCACDVHVAESGKQGLRCFEHALAENIPFDVLFVDLLMPVSNGIEMMKSLRSTHGAMLTNIAVAATIGVANQIDQFVEDCENDISAFGFTHIVVKPCDHEIIKSIINFKLESRKEHETAKPFPVHQSVAVGNNKGNIFSLIKLLKRVFSRKVEPSVSISEPGPK